MDTITVEAVRELLAQGCSDAEIGERFGLSRSTAMRFRRSHGLASATPQGVRHCPAKTDAPPAPSAKPITVAEFLLNKRRAVCPVCKLKDSVKAMVTDAKKKGERQADILEYLQAVHRITITPREFTAHAAGRHET